MVQCALRFESPSLSLSFFMNFSYAHAARNLKGMAPHNITIAKASISAGFMRPDPHSLSREQISDFHKLLETAIAQCSPINIQVWHQHLY
jgi:hypothetical protein